MLQPVFVLMSQITHLNTVNHVYSWTIASLKSRYLPAFLKPEYGKKVIKDNTVRFILSFHKIFINIQKIYSPTHIVRSRILFDPYCLLKFSYFNQKLVFYFCFKHLENLESGTRRVDPYYRFRKIMNFYKKHIGFVVEFFSIFLANSDQGAIQFDPCCPFKNLIYCLFKDLIKIST